MKTKSHFASGHKTKTPSHCDIIVMSGTVIKDRTAGYRPEVLTMTATHADCSQAAQLTAKAGYLDEIITSEVKGYPPNQPPMPRSYISRQKWDMFRDLTPPFCVLREDALQRNEKWMLEFCKTFNLSIAPHGKTTMSPQLFQRQLAHGAWAITLATPVQLRVARTCGFRRIILANQLIENADIAAVLTDMAADPDYELYILVDSIEGVKRLVSAYEARETSRPLNVLLECGYVGGRTGCRNVESAMQVARAITKASQFLHLVGIEAFEGLLQSTPDSEAIPLIDDLLELCVKVAQECERLELFNTDTIILTAGGSAFYDCIPKRFRAAQIRRAHSVVIRSGCYLTLDAGAYEKSLTRIVKRTAGAVHAAAPINALEVVGTVLSRPESARVIVNFGRRDVGHDSGFPVPLYVCTNGHVKRNLDENCIVAAINDQHIHLQIPPDATLGVGDRIAFAISHPCTTFDKWKLIYVVDQQDRVVDAVTTFF